MMGITADILSWIKDYQLLSGLVGVVVLAVITVIGWYVSSRIRKSRSPKSAKSPRPQATTQVGKGNIAAQASDQAKIQQINADSGGGPLTINQPGVTLDANALFKEALEQTRCAEGLRWENRQLREENERLKQAAIARAESAARDEQDQTAAQATDQIRQTGNTALLLEFLLQRRNDIQTKAKEDCIEINREISAVAYLWGEIAIAEEALDQILQVAPGNLEAIRRKGHVHLLRGDLDKAGRSYQHVLDLATARDDRTYQAIAYGNLGILYETRGDLDEAEGMFRKALEINEALGRKEGMASNYGDLGNFYRIRGDLDESEEMCRKSLQIEEALDHKEGMATDYGNIGILYKRRGNPDEAERMFRKALEINEALGRKESMANDYGNLGNVHLSRRDLDEAERMYRKSLQINEALGRKEGMAIQHANLGLLYKRRGDLAKARDYWIKARDIFSQIPMPHMVEKIQKWLDKSAARRSKK